MLKKINHRKIIFVLIFLVVMVLTNPCTFQFFSLNSEYCFDPLDEKLRQSIGMFSMPLFLILFILFFLRKEVFFTWIKFAIPALFFSLLAIFTTATSSGGLFSVGLPDFDRALTTLILGILFFFISLVLIIYKSLSLKENDLKVLENGVVKSRKFRIIKRIIRIVLILCFIGFLLLFLTI